MKRRWRRTARFWNAFPEDHRALNNTGVLYFQLGDHEQARAYYQRALDLDSTWAIGFTNLAFEQQVMGDFDTATATLDEMERLYPGNPRTTDARAGLALVGEDYAVAESLWTALAESQSGSLFWRAGVAENLAHLDLLQGKLREGQQDFQEAAGALAQRGLPDQRIHLFWESARVLMDPGVAPSQALIDALSDDVMNAMPVADRWYESAVLYYALRGDGATAQRFVRDMEASGFVDLGQDFERDLDRARGWASVASGDAEEGLRLLRSGMAGWPCEPCVMSQMALAHDAAGNVDSVKVYWQRYIDMNWGLTSIESWARPIGYRRLGEIHEAEGDAERALGYYDRFVTLWNDADPEFQPLVADVRARMARLAGESRN